MQTLYQSLTAHHIRNINQVEIEPISGLNCFYGENGSGKTSMLEALQVLATGRSFRTNKSEHLIQQQQEAFLVAATTIQQQYVHSMGIEKSRHGDSRLRLNGEAVSAHVHITRYLPTIALTTQCHQLLTDSPKRRRQFLHWGLFHVEPSFYRLWQEYQYTLKQRNACLKQQRACELQLWNEQFVERAIALDLLTQTFLEALMPEVIHQAQQLIPEHAIELSYHRGWAQHHSIEEALQAHLERDSLIGYTSVGPHRADLAVHCSLGLAADILSQGQLKLLAYAMWLAQLCLLQTKAKPTILIDDMPSELDDQKQLRVAKTLASCGAQTFLTSISAAAIEPLAPLWAEGVALFEMRSGTASLR